MRNAQALFVVHLQRAFADDHALVGVGWSWERLKGRLGEGTWKGLERSWGNSRAFLNAKSVTDS